MAANLMQQKQQVTRGMSAVLANNENRVSQIPSHAANADKLKGLRPVPGAQKIAVSSSFSSNTNTSGVVNGGLRNRTIGTSNLMSASLRQSQQKPAPMDLSQQIRPEDWIVVPPPKPNDVYNIDTDFESHLMCPSLAPAQYAYLMSIEDKFMTDMGFLSRTKLDAHSRLVIVNWMTTVHRQFAEQQESLFLAVNYFDRFLAACPTGFTSAQLVAATALYIACKFEEIYAPSIDQICSSTDQPRAKPHDVRRVEFEMLRSLRFRVNPPLLNHFLRRCSKAAGATALLHSLGKYLIEISLYDPDLATGTKPSLVAAAASYIAILVFGERTHEWDNTMQHYSGGYSELEVRPISSKLIQLHRQLTTREGSLLVKAKWEDMLKHPVFAEWVRNTTI